MQVYEETFSVKTSRRSEMIDISYHIDQMICSNNIERGEVTIFCPHTTAAITINENADPDVQHDMMLALDQQFPKQMAGFQHAEGNSDSHVKSSLVGVSERVLVSNGSLVLGTWQGIYFCEFDGPRTRRVMVRICSY